MPYVDYRGCSKLNLDQSATHVNPLTQRVLESFDEFANGDPTFAEVGYQQAHHYGSVLEVKYNPTRRRPPMFEASQYVFRHCPATIEIAQHYVPRKSGGGRLWRFYSRTPGRNVFNAPCNSACHTMHEVMSMAAAKTDIDLTHYFEGYSWCNDRLTLWGKAIWGKNKRQQRAKQEGFCRLVSRMWGHVVHFEVGPISGSEPRIFE